MKVTAALACLLFLSGCSWMKFWEDEQDSAPSEVAGLEFEGLDAEGQEQAVATADREPRDLDSFEVKVRFQRIWRESVGKGDDSGVVTLAPGLDEGLLVAANNEGRVVAWRAESGEQVWRNDLDLRFSGGPGLGAGHVALGTLGGELVLLDGVDGAELWRVQLSSEVLSSPAIMGQRVFVQTQDGRLSALSLEDGSELWQYRAELPVLTLRGTAAPVASDKTVLAGFASGKLVALAPDTGTVLWEARLVGVEGKTELERIVDVHTPVQGGEVVYASAYQGRVGAYSRGAGRELWAVKASSFKAPAWTPGRVFMIADDDRVEALRASGGQVQWSNAKLSYRRLSAPLVVADLVIVADQEGYLHALDQSDGSIVGREKVGGDGVSSTPISDGKLIFVQDHDGRVSAYGLQSES